MNLRTLSLFAIASLAPAIETQAAEVLLAPGVTSEGQNTASIALGLDWEQRWFERDAGHLTGYWSFAYTWWEAGDLSGDQQTVSVSPVFVYQFGGRWKSFLEIGMGAAYFTDDRVGDKKLGSRLHFEDRFGAGIRFSDRDSLRVRVIHYSNAGLEDPNQGIESWSLVYARRF